MSQAQASQFRVEADATRLVLSMTDKQEEVVQAAAERAREEERMKQRRLSHQLQQEHHQRELQSQREVQSAQAHAARAGAAVAEREQALVTEQNKRTRAELDRGEEREKRERAEQKVTTHHSTTQHSPLNIILHHPRRNERLLKPQQRGKRSNGGKSIRRRAKRSAPIELRK